MTRYRNDIPQGSCSEKEPPECTPKPPCKTTYCDRDTTNNVWVEHGVGGEESVGICLLDTMNEAQVIDVLQRDDRARADLIRVTSDPNLLELARTVPKLPVTEEVDDMQTEFNRNDEAASIPFYAIFRGQPPFAQ